MIKIPLVFPLFQRGNHSKFIRYPNIIIAGNNSFIHTFNLYFKKLYIEAFTQLPQES